MAFMQIDAGYLDGLFQELGNLLQHPIIRGNQEILAEVNDILDGAYVPPVLAEQEMDDLWNAYEDIQQDLNILMQRVGEEEFDLRLENFYEDLANLEDRIEVVEMERGIFNN
ncbi:YlbF family regulator [Caenorhabditis elegans]|uniref:YlbF family regulator n=1 Tax=Caenorhabditis elegans TaxID=6239 RepID=E8MDU8_CAEEL|nr:YlbF family regulator [Caenorhabditis elegans]CCD69655.1 YlbF family regulator [Caenorhabditis elegans]|eukprot:NP_001254074.1 Uncharacterized protein CELE_T06D4.6 [Caenorhabditis elegans]